MVLPACSKQCIDEVISQTVNAKNKVTAVHVETNCGATTGLAHQIYIIVPGTDYADAQPIFVADKVDKLTVTWLNEKTLQIDFGTARIFNFKNFWLSAEVDNFQYEIRVVLHEGR